MAMGELGNRPLVERAVLAPDILEIERAGEAKFSPSARAGR